MEYLNIRENYLSKTESDELFDSIIELELECEPKGKIFGKEIVFHRNIGFFSDDSIGYKFSGRLMKSKKLTVDLKNLLNKVNNEFNTKYNGILINLYKDGNDYISMHRDNESEIGDQSIRCISLGCSRIFRLRNYNNKREKYDIITGHGQMIEMLNECNEKYTHEIVKDRSTDIRISITFRHHRI